MRKNEYTYMFRVNDMFIVSKGKFRCSETRNLSANKNFLAFYTTQQTIDMLTNVLHRIISWTTENEVYI